MKLTEEQIVYVRSLEDDLERITPDRIVADAKNKQSPLHDLFEWDKAKAAAAHWLDQARAIIGAVRVEVVNQTTKLTVRVYTRDPDAHGEQGYRSVAALRTNPESARQSLIYTLEHVAGHMRRAQELAEQLGLSGEIDGLLEKIVGVQQSLKKAA